MITDDQLTLLTAAVDGELTPVETLRFRRLLDSSAEARAVYVRLKADSVRLRTLPQMQPPVGLYQRVMARIAATTPLAIPGGVPATNPVSTPRHSTRSPERAPPVTTPATGSLSTPPARQASLDRKRMRKWIPVAAAASLLLGVMGSSFWFFVRKGDAAGDLARNPNHPPPATHRGANDPDWARWLPPEAGPQPTAPRVAEVVRPQNSIVREDHPTPIPLPRDPTGVAIAPEPRTQNHLIGSPLSPEVPPFDLVQVRVPFLRSLAEFDRDDTRQQFTDELGRDPAFRIDLFTRDTARGVEWFRAAAKHAGLTLHVDGTTLDRVNKRQVASVVIYTEALTAPELAALFARLCVEDARISPRVFDVLHTTPVLLTDQTALKSILGIDPGLFKRPTAEKNEKSDKVLDGPKPISAGTADQVVKSLTTGQQRSEKGAVLMTWAPDAARTIPNNSQELKQFLLKRGERKPNAVPVVIIIRPGSSEMTR